MRLATVLIILVASFAVAAPALALSEAACSALGTASQNSGGIGSQAIGGVISQNCSSSASSAPVVATAEPLSALAVGLGLIGARLVRRG